MDKKKSEQLKKVLDETMSSEEIEKKLKEEKAKKALNILRSEDETTMKKEEKKESAFKEKVEIPNIRDKKQENKNLNITLILTSIIALLLLIATIYIFTKEENIEKKQTKEMTQAQEEVKKEILEPKTKALEKITEQTPLNKESEKEVEKIKAVEEIKKETEEVLKPSNETQKPKIKEIVKEVVVTKVVNLEKSNFKEYYNSLKYKSLKCYDFKAGDIFPNKKCKSDLKTFLEKNKKALRFEVIPVIAEDDNLVFTKMEANLKTMDENFKNRVKEYMFRGLSRERVLETSWEIKEILGEDVILTPTNYYVKSKKNNKGVIIKAYH